MIYVRIGIGSAGFFSAADFRFPKGAGSAEPFDPVKP